MKSSAAIGLADVLDYLERRGVLLETDHAFPSITGVTIPEPIKGSWWAHPMANEIYMLSQQLTHHPDTICLKLLSGKTSYVHRRLWPELIAIGTAREPWQLDALLTSAKSMLNRVEQRGIARMDELKGSRTTKEKSADARVLELRLLVFGDDVHTESGAHVKRVETWEHWAWRTGFHIEVLPAPVKAKEEFAKIVADLNQRFGATATLPWQQTRMLKRTASRQKTK